MYLCGWIRAVASQGLVSFPSAEGSRLRLHGCICVCVCVWSEIGLRLLFSNRTLLGIGIIPGINGRVTESNMC